MIKLASCCGCTCGNCSHQGGTNHHTQICQDRIWRKQSKLRPRPATEVVGWMGSDGQPSKFPPSVRKPRWSRQSIRPQFKCWDLPEVDRRVPAKVRRCKHFWRIQGASDYTVTLICIHCGLVGKLTL